MSAPDATGISKESILALEREIGRLIQRVRRVMGERAHLVHPELQAPGYLILMSVAQSCDGVRSSEIVESLGLDKGAVSRQVQHLVDLGLVEKQQDACDRRAWTLTLASGTQALLDQVTTLRRAELEARLGDWTDADFDALITLLARYNASIESG